MTPAPNQMAEWLEAAGFDSEDQAAVNAVKKVGEFLRNNGNFPDDELCERLASFDYQVAPIVVRLPNSVFVRHEETGMWLTDTGLSTSTVKPFAGRAIRPLLTPLGSVAALRSAPREPLPVVRPGDLFRGIAPSVKAELQQSSQRGTTHFCVLNFSLLRTIR